MSARSTRRRLNRAFERLSRRESIREGNADSVERAAAARSVRSLRTTAMMASFFVLVALGIVLSYELQRQQIAVLDDSFNNLAKVLADHNAEAKKSAETGERALALANRQAAALEAANKIADDALAVDRRAWVGVVGARIEGSLEPNADLTIAIDYRNTGHEPAADLAAIATPFLVETEKRAEPQTMSRLEQFADRCLAENYVGGGIAFPSSEAQTYKAIVKASEIDNAVVDGRKLVIVETCIVYMSGGAIHHSASCHFFQSGRTPSDRFSLCAKGAAAD